MTDENDKARTFVESTLEPVTPIGGYRELGTTRLAHQLALQEDQLNGHWCSRCEGIWYGSTLEVECPCCGNRHG